MCPCCINAHQNALNLELADSYYYYFWVHTDYNLKYKLNADGGVFQ